MDVCAFVCALPSGSGPQGAPSLLSLLPSFASPQQISLLAALSAGRNSVNQDIIKKLVPVDFILGALEKLTNVTDFAAGDTGKAQQHTPAWTAGHRQAAASASPAAERGKSDVHDAKGEASDQAGESQEVLREVRSELFQVSVCAWARVCECTRYYAGTCVSDARVRQWCRQTCCGVGA